MPKGESKQRYSENTSPEKRRKSRTAFTNQQIYELEKRFLYQKYLTPADRDEIAQSLGLTNAQVITWFQNRRAKLKRDLEELKNDVTAAKKVTILGKLNPTITELEYIKSQRNETLELHSRRHRQEHQTSSSPEHSPVNSPSKSSDDAMEEDQADDSPRSRRRERVNARGNHGYNVWTGLSLGNIAPSSTTE